MRSLLFAIVCFGLVVTACGQYETENLTDPPPEIPDVIDDPDSRDEPLTIPEVACIKGLNQDLFLVENLSEEARCKKANSSQKREVKRGNAKKDKFLQRCYEETDNSCWCDQLVRPNPSSKGTFICTYGPDLPHQLVHPSESTWKYAIEAVKIVEDLFEKNIHTSIIYNWWRPEPYNKNVGGSPTRHPHGTSIDVRFASKEDQNKAHRELCNMRRRGRVRAIGYYQSTALHFGVGDRRGNTWGKSCP